MDSGNNYLVVTPDEWLCSRYSSSLSSRRVWRFGCRGGWPLECPSAALLSPKVPVVPKWAGDPGVIGEGWVSRGGVGMVGEVFKSVGNTGVWWLFWVGSVFDFHRHATTASHQVMIAGQSLPNALGARNYALASMVMAGERGRLGDELTTVNPPGGRRSAEPRAN